MTTDYLVESYKQAIWDPHASPDARLAGDIDGYGLIVKSIAMRGSDPEMELAAALSCMGRKREAGQDAYVAHLQKAADGAQEGSLLARNLLTHFNNMGNTIAELRANAAAIKN